jgi:hypothetical protein
MDNRKWQAAASATPPADEASPSSGYPTDGNPSTPTPATIPGARWFHQVGEEIRAVIAAAGLTPDSTVLTQLRDAIQAMIVGAQKAVIINGVTFEASVADGEAVRWDSGNSRFDEAIADGTANNRAVGIADVTNSRVYLYGECPLFSGLTPGSRYYLDASTAGAITATAPTDAVQIGIAKSATVLWVDVDVAQAPPAQTLIVSDQKAQGTAAGGSSVGVQTRTLNTVDKNTIAGASVSSNQITLPAGTYRVFAQVPAINVNAHRAHLYNVTDSAVSILGTCENATAPATSDSVETWSEIIGDITIAATKVFEIRHYTGGAEATHGLGVAMNISGYVEQYTKVVIDRR